MNLQVQEVLPLFEGVSIVDFIETNKEDHASSSSNAELLAQFLNPLPRGKRSSDFMEGRFDLARSLLVEAGGLRGLLSNPAEYLEADECQRIFALKEIFLRYLKEKMKRDSDPLTSPAMMRQYLVGKVRDLPHEVFGVIYLDNQHRVLEEEILFRGTIDGASVYPREVVKGVLARNSAAVVFYHNHPSGEAEPSRADRAITERLKSALEAIDVRVLDHFVVGDGYCESFAERGWL